MSDKICIKRVRHYNVEQFRRKFRMRITGACVLTGIFLCVITLAIVRFV